MRNLKKLLAVIVSVCVLATFALPAFAAELTAAEIVEDLGVLKGDSSEGVTATYLAKGTSRMQAAVLTLRLIGKEDEAYAFEGEDNFADADQTWDNAKVALAYLKANPELGWQGVSESANTFDPKAEISAQQMYKVCLEALGYKQDTDFTWAEVFTFAEGKGLKLIADVTDMTNNDVATALVEALKATMKDGKTTLIADLVAKGVVTEAAAIAAGLIAATPDELEVASVTATNLIQAVVTFNQKVDNDTATDKDNYDFATADKLKVKEAALAEDGVSVVLTFDTVAKQQQKAKLTVNNVKSVEGVAMAKTTEEVYFLDNTIPEILSAEVVGVSSIKVAFSEPMDKASIQTASYYKVNDGKYYVRNATAQKNDTEVIVELYTSLKDGDLPFEVKVGPKDYAGFTAMGLTTTLTVVEDKEAPTVVSYKDAKPNSVTLIWNEDIVLVKNATENYYHTNSKNQIKAVLNAVEDIDGNEMTLRFDDDSKLPNGTAYIYVLKEAVKDRWNNKNAQQMTMLDVVADNDAPVLQSIEVKAEDKIVAAFDEDLKVAPASKRANYKLLDKDGKEIKNKIRTATPDGKKVTIIFVENLDGGDYTLVVEDIEDLAGNEMASTSMGFTITDKTAPSDFKAKIYDVRNNAGTPIDQIIKVSFGEEMTLDGTYGIDDLSKYVLTGVKAIEDIDDVTLAVVDDGKGVEITIPVAKHSVVSGTDKLSIARVADAAGNYTVDLVNLVDIDTSLTVGIEKAELTGEKEIKVYFTDTLDVFESKELSFTAGGDVTGVTTEIKDGNTVATYTFDGALPYNTSGLAITVDPVAGAAGIVSANRYGELLDDDISARAVADKLAPGLATFGADNDDDVIVKLTDRTLEADKYVSTITITFNEDLDFAYLSYASFEVSGFKVKTIDPVGTDGVKIVVEDDDLYVDVNTAISLKSPLRDALAGNELTELETSVQRYDSANVNAKAAGVALTLTASGAAGDVKMPVLTGLGYTIKVKTTSAATIYDANGKIVADGSSNVVYTVTETATGLKADTGTVVVTVDVTP